MSSKTKQRHPSKKTSNQKSKNQKKNELKIKIEASGTEKFKIVDFGVSSIQGKRDYMEDTFVGVAPEKECDLGERDILGYFGVFDGHGGSQTSAYLQDHFFDHIWQNVKIVDKKISSWKQNLTQSFLSLEEEIHKSWLQTQGKNLDNSGSTAVSVIVRSKEIVCANVGDSRAVFSRAGEVIPLSNDQRPSRKCERKRLEEKNIKINENYVEANGYLLSISRTFADFELKESPEPIVKHPLAPIPEIVRIEPLRGETNFILLGSDGLWDVISNEDAVSFVKAAYKRFNGNIQKIAQALVNSALGRGSKDNITAIVVCLEVEDDDEHQQQQEEAEVEVEEVERDGQEEKDDQEGEAP